MKHGFSSDLTQQQPQQQPQQPQGGVFIDISGFNVVREPPSVLGQPPREYICFVIKIRLGAFAWTVYRRFSHFRQLGDLLLSKIPDAPTCPQKRSFGGSTHSVAALEQRRSELVEWVRLLARDERVCRSPEFHEFLRAHANAPPVGMTNEGFMSTEGVGGVSGSFPPRGGLQQQPSSPPLPPRHPHQVAHPHEAGSTAVGIASGGGIASTGPLLYEDPSTANGGTANALFPSQMSSTSKSMLSQHRVGLKEFVLLKVVGKGSFGKVMQVRKRDTGRIYAMKVLQKAHIIKRNQVEHTKTERNVLSRIVHPFIVGLNYAFQTQEKLYFVLDYCAGGELFFHLGREGKFDEDRSRFYTAQIVLALEHLHMMNVIYRDLKPENVLLDHNGNIRLTDFGLSKENVDAVDRGAHSFCGTPEYLAPEVLSRSGHGRAVDWWSLGALLFEMLTGLPPFYSRDRNVLFEKIQKGDLEYPAYLSANAKDLLRRLLVRDPLARLGSGPGDAAELKAHPFFGPIDWRAVLEGRVEVPWVPVVRNSADTSQFDAEFTTMDVHSPSSVAASNLLAASGGVGGHLTPQQQEALAAQQQQQVWAQQQAAQMKLQQQQQLQGIGSSSATLGGSGGGGGGGGIALASHHPMIDATISTPKQQPFEGFTYIAPHQIGKAKGLVAAAAVVTGGGLAAGSVNPLLTQAQPPPPNPPPLAWGQQTQQAQKVVGAMRVSMDVDSSLREDDAEMK